MTKGKEKLNVNIVMLGSENSGKATMTARLMYEMGSHLDKGNLDSFEIECSNWMLETLKNERKAGVTDNTLWKFETAKNCYTIIDPPDSNPNLFNKNKITGKKVDFALIMIDSTTNSDFSLLGSLDLDNDKDVAYPAMVAFTKDVKQILCIFNKMDLISFSKDKFEYIRKKLSIYLLSVGYLASEIFFVPISAKHGDNVVFKSSKSEFSWYLGPTLHQLLDSLAEIKFMNRDQQKNADARGYCKYIARKAACKTDCYFFDNSTAREMSDIVKVYKSSYMKSVRLKNSLGIKSIDLKIMKEKLDKQSKELKMLKEQMHRMRSRIKFRFSSIKLEF